jgi:RecJ-like exonuclease
MAHIAVIGAIGDVQERIGFTGLNRAILEDAINAKTIEVEPGLRLYGIHSRPLTRVLHYSNEVPGINSESEAVQFLQELKINPKKGNSWKKYSDLSEKELKKLISAVVMKRLDTNDPEAVVGPRYILLNENHSLLKDAKEFATLLNACGRLGKVSLGIGVCINDKKLKAKAIRALDQYKKQVLKNLEWYRNAKEGEVIKGQGFILINAQDNVNSTMIGTLASMVARIEDLKPGTFVLGLAHVLDGTSKFSLRISKDLNGTKLNELAAMLGQTVGGSGGGHNYAAGGLIPASKESEFLNEAQKILSNASMEEVIQ